MSDAVPAKAHATRRPLHSKLHAASGIVSHKGPGNVPWRSTRERPIKSWLMRDVKAWYNAGPVDKGSPCCKHEPNDACTPRAVGRWLQFADWYTWPHVRYYDTPEELMRTIDVLIANASLRMEISGNMKAFFKKEKVRAKGHVLAALKRALDARGRVGE